MKIVDKVKFIRTMMIFVIIICVLIIFSKSIYSKGKIIYKESYIYSGDTLWSIAKSEIEDNKYFQDKDIREVINELKSINNLKDSKLIEGNKIKIPIYE